MNFSIKIASLLILISITLLSAMPIALASTIDRDSPIRTLSDIERVLNDIVEIIYIIFFIVAIFFILIAAFSFLTAQADPEKINIAYKRIFYAAIAIAIALISIGVEKIILDILN